MFSSPSAAASLFLMVKVYHFAQIPSSNFLFFRLSDETFRFFSSPCCRFTHPLLHFSENFSILAFPLLQAAKERIAGLFNILRFVRRPPNRTVLARPSGAFGRTVQRKKKKARIVTIRTLNLWWEVVDSNHRSHRRQIYSLFPLATREPLHSELQAMLACKIFSLAWACPALLPVPCCPVRLSLS